ncbi:MAG: hypothetical protein WB611_20320, partial [Stellaceae bacterium]
MNIFFAPRMLVLRTEQMIPPISSPPRKCFVSEDWRDGVRLWQAVEWLWQQRRMREAAQLVPVV